MPAPFTSTLDPSVGQYYIPNAGQYGGTNPNPNPVMTSPTNPLGWGDVNTYAPWMTPNGSNNQNSSFSGYGQEGSTSGNAFKWGGLGQVLNFGQGSWFGLGKKMSSPNFYAPSYQGTLFDPGNGYGATYGMSQEGLSSMAQQQSAMPQGSPAGSNPAITNTPQGYFGTGPQYAGAMGPQSQQSYLGQSPYAVAGQTYVPSGGMSYGGYSNYGGYGASGTQPYIPGQ